MNSLSKQITGKIFLTSAEYLNFIAQWRQLARAKDPGLCAEMYLLYAILRGKDYRKAFSEPVSQSRRNQWKFPKALDTIHTISGLEWLAKYRALEKLLTEEQLKHLPEFIAMHVPKMGNFADPYMDLSAQPIQVVYDGVVYGGLEIA